MLHLSTITARKLLIITHDLVMTVLAVLASFYIRFEGPGLLERYGALKLFLPLFVVYAGVIYAFFDLYRAKWRFASLPDLFNILRAVTILSLSLVVLDWVLASSGFYNSLLFGKITIALYFILQICFLGGPRMAYRYYRYSRTQARSKAAEASPTLLAGRATDADVFLRAVESGAIHKLRPVGILSPAPSDRGQSIRGVPVLGRFEDLDDVIRSQRQNDVQISRVVLTPSAFDSEQAVERMLVRAKKLGLTASRIPSLEEGRSLDGQVVHLAPVDVEDLLLRPRVEINYRRLEAFAHGRAAIVTGGGGSIGAEICDRLVSFGVSRLLILENAEPSLHHALETLRLKSSDTVIEGHIADVRDRDRVFRMFEAFKPDLVFHAAALKHVPILERDWQEGIKTNILGSVNVCDAAIASGAAALVMISTDKAIEPVSMLGATKRFAEMYAQAHDLAVMTASGSTPKTRLISVRFGNVLGSSGSVVPKFKTQIEAGGPVTVTHPDMVRYFMTIREACDLVVTAASHALEAVVPPVSIYVLNMGQPVRILDVAERMIRLAGLEPHKDIEIVFSGIRPGERLNEILFAHDEPSRPIGVPGIVAAQTGAVTLAKLRPWLSELEAAVAADDRGRAEALLIAAVPDFRTKAA